MGCNEEIGKTGKCCKGWQKRKDTGSKDREKESDRRAMGESEHSDPQDKSEGEAKQKSSIYNLANWK